MERGCNVGLWCLFVEGLWSMPRLEGESSLFVVAVEVVVGEKRSIGVGTVVPVGEQIGIRRRLLVGETVVALVVGVGVEVEVAEGCWGMFLVLQRRISSFCVGGRRRMQLHPEWLHRGLQPLQRCRQWQRPRCQILQRKVKM